MWLVKHDVMGLFCGCNDKYVIKVLIQHGSTGGKIVYYIYIKTKILYIYIYKN